MKTLKTVKSCNQFNQLNVLAKKALISLKEPVIEYQLHAFQLMEWAINNKVALSNETLDWTLLKAQEITPTKTMTLLKQLTPKNLPTDPEELALTLIQEMEAEIQDSVPDYYAEVAHLNRFR